jgi:PAS domain S-box-containing protein
MSADDNLPFLTWHARPDMSCEYVNWAWLEYTGYTLDQALGEGWTRCLHPEDLPRWLDTCVRAFDERRPFDIEYRLRRHDGGYRWMLERAAPRHGADGAFLGYRGACVDIDAHKQERHDLARSLERERRARQGLAMSVLQELRHLPRAQAKVISDLVQRASPTLLGVRVLVVDQASEDVVKVLEAAGADVRVAATSAEALRSVGAWHPDVILSDSDGSLRAAADGQRAELAKPVEPVALLATVARLAA